MHLTSKKQPSLSARRQEKFLVQNTFITLEDTKDPQSIVRTVSFVTQTNLKLLQWNVRDAASDERTICSQKLPVICLPRLGEEESAGSDVRFGLPVLLCITGHENNFQEISNPTAVSTESTCLPSASPPTSLPPSRSDSSNREESRSESRPLPGLGIVSANPERPLPPTPVLTAQGKNDLEQQLSGAQEEIRYLRTLLALSEDGANSATDADARTRTSTPKSLAAGVESMMAALRNFVHPLASSELSDGVHI
jgi:hypothetical protein